MHAFGVKCILFFNLFVSVELRSAVKKDCLLVMNPYVSICLNVVPCRDRFICSTYLILGQK